MQLATPTIKTKITALRISVSPYSIFSLRNQIWFWLVYVVAACLCRPCSAEDPETLGVMMLRSEPANLFRPNTCSRAKTVVVCHGVLFCTSSHLVPVDGKMLLRGDRIS